MSSPKPEKGQQPGQGLEGARHAPSAREAEGARAPHSVVVVEIRRLSLCLNKEVHGRHLLLLEAADSTVRACAGT